MEVVWDGRSWHVSKDGQEVGIVENRCGRLLWYLKESPEYGWADFVDDCLEAMEEAL